MPSLDIQGFFLDNLRHVRVDYFSKCETKNGIQGLFRNATTRQVCFVA